MKRITRSSVQWVLFAAVVTVAAPGYGAEPSPWCVRACASPPQKCESTEPPGANSKAQKLVGGKLVTVTVRTAVGLAYDRARAKCNATNRATEIWATVMAAGDSCPASCQHALELTASKVDDKLTAEAFVLRLPARQVGKLVWEQVQPKMVLIPAGTFWMGCNANKDTNCNNYEKPRHKVTLSAYYMDVTETTVAQYKACVDAGVCTVPSAVQPAGYATYPGLTTNPVNYVSWTQSQAYCKWRGAAFHLPTEAQWEMAARGSCEKNGSTAGDAGCAAAMRTYPWGETVPTASYAVTSGSGSTAAVGSKTAGDSPYGLHDMAGNVWEWNRDWHDTYSAGAVTDPVGPASASARVIRGGSFATDAAPLRAGFRDDWSPSVAYHDFGLRCMRSYP